MGKISYLHIVAYLQFAGIRDFTHDTFYKRRLTLAVFAHECHFLAPLDGECSVVKYLMVSIGLTYIVCNDRIVARTRSRGETQIEARFVHLIHLYTLYLVKLLDAALHLHTLRSLIAETLYEVLGVLYLLLLIEICTHLLFDAFFAKLHEFRIIDRVVIYLAQRYFYGAVSDIVDKRTVMATALARFIRNDSSHWMDSISR